MSDYVLTIPGPPPTHNRMVLCRAVPWCCVFQVERALARMRKAEEDAELAREEEERQEREAEEASRRYAYVG